MQNSNLQIGLFGYGCVGSGLFKVLQQTNSLNIQVKKIGVKHIEKPRDIDSSYFTNNPDELLFDPAIQIIVELINNEEDALYIVSTALKLGKAVVTANKKLLANHFEYLLELQRIHNAPLLYEAAAGGSIPIIRTLEEYYDNDTLTRVEGILNGTTNYLLTGTLENGKSYEEVLHEAQQLGFAELNPELDVEGYDARFKLCLLIMHAYGLLVKPSEIFKAGISNLKQGDIKFAREKSYVIKLLACAIRDKDKLTAYVVPHFLPKYHDYAGVRNEFNAVQVIGAFSDCQLLKGKGAGSYPTAAAVLSDLSALKYGYKYAYRKRENCNLELDKEALIRIYLRYEQTSILSKLFFETVEEEFVSKTFSYLIGEVQLKNLYALDAEDLKEVFIAFLPNCSIENATAENLNSLSSISVSVE